MTVATDEFPGVANLYYLDETALSFYEGKWDQRTEDIYLFRFEGEDRLFRGSSLPIWFSAPRFRNWLSHLVTFRRKRSAAPRREKNRP
jgi:hypothetical protein